MKTYADKHFLTAKKKNTTQRGTVKQTWGNPACSSKPPTPHRCNAQDLSHTFSGAQTPTQTISRRKVHISRSSYKTDPTLQIRTPSGIAHLCSQHRRYPQGDVLSPLCWTSHTCQKQEEKPISSWWHLPVLFCLPTLARLNPASLNADAILIHVSI